MERLEPARARLKSPFKIYLWITSQCNLSCRYCYAAPLSGSVMDRTRLDRLIDELHDLDVINLVFGGGEPFLHPDVFHFLKKALRNRRRIGVISNGSLLTGKVREELIRLFQNERHFLLQISLDSPDPSINDLVRGEGAVVLNNIKELGKQGVALQTSTVLTQYNIETAHRIIDELYPLVKRFNFLEVQRTRKMLEDPSKIPTREQSQEFWCKLREYAERFPPDLHLPSLKIRLKRENDFDFDLGVKSNEATFRSGVCSSGHTMVHIDSDFNVLGCCIAKDYTYMGNIKDRSFQEIWNSERADEIRSAPFPLCYKNRDIHGEALEDCLRFDLRM